MQNEKVKRLADEVLATEARALESLRTRLDERFVQACELLAECGGHIVLTGIGKSGHVARKIAATLSSTGNPAIYMHPAEANHGDLGVLRDGDILVALSYSGETEEIKSLLPAFKRLGARIIAVTGDCGSSLGRAADVCLDVSVDKEACPLELAPTASTTAMLAVGDCLSAVLLTERGFSNEDFAKRHPGGQLGRRLLVHLGDVMRRGDEVPMVPESMALIDALYEMSSKRLGMTLVGEGDHVAGVFTDGDLRRAINNDVELRTTPVGEVMNRDYQSFTESELASDALERMEEKKINSAPVFDAAGRLVGALNLHDLLRAGV